MSEGVNTMVVIHLIDGDEMYVVSNEDQAKNKTDRIGIKEAIEIEDAVTIGRTVYEYSAALANFVKTQGHHWRSALREAWCSGVYPSCTPKNDVPALQRLRNSIGGSL
ncbi:MAG: hypothetical protein PHT07_10370 [Paludibacter sp.]|nr:hypothetical protein [Paludibacter sp.]